MKVATLVTTEKKQRDHKFDLLKGIAIYLVVMGHVLTMCIRGLDAAFIFKFIENVHMPVFFFISGYFSFKQYGSRTYCPPKLGKRFCQLMIPFFVVSALWVLYFPHSGLQSPLSDNLPDLYRSYWKDGYWFPLCLFELCLIYYGVSRLLSKLNKTGAQVLLMIVVYVALQALAWCFSSEENNVDYLCLGLLAQFFPIFMIGVMAHKFKDLFNSMTHCNSSLAVAAIVFGVLLFVVAYPWDMPWGSSSMGTSLIRMVALPVMHLSLIVIAMAAIEPWALKEYNGNDENHNKPGVVARYFNLLGKESLAIYLLHYFFLFPLTMLQEPLKSMALGFTPLAVVTAIVAFVIIALTLLVVYIINRSRWLSLVLIGKY